MITEILGGPYDGEKVTWEIPVLTRMFNGRAIYHKQWKDPTSGKFYYKFMGYNAPAAATTHDQSF